MRPPQSFFLTAQDGVRLFVRDWVHAQHGVAQTRPSVLLLHGLAEHSARHDALINYFIVNGFSVRAYDQRGHGRSEGKRGDVPHRTALMDDAEIVLKDFAAQGHPLPFLFGHSMGGLIAAYLASVTTTPLAGLILSSPALALPLSPSALLLARCLVRIAPHWALPFIVSARALSHDQAVFVSYKQDPLVHNKITAQLLHSLLFAIHHVQSHAACWKTPTLLLFAKKDCLVDPAGSERFLAQLPKGCGMGHAYQDYYHEIFNEIGKERVFDDLIRWLNQQVWGQ